MFGTKIILQVSSINIYGLSCNANVGSKVINIWKGKVNFWTPCTSLYPVLLCLPFQLTLSRSFPASNVIYQLPAKEKGCKLVRQQKSKGWAEFELEYLLLLNIYLRRFKIQKLGLIPKRNHLKYITLHSPFCLFIRKNAITKLPSYVLRNLLLLMEPSDVLQNSSFWHQERRT